MPFEGWLAFFDDQYAQIGVFAQVVGRKKTGRTGSHHNDVVIIPARRHLFLLE